MLIAKSIMIVIAIIMTLTTMKSATAAIPIPTVHVPRPREARHAGETGPAHWEAETAAKKKLKFVLKIIKLLT